MTAKDFEQFLKFHIRKVDKRIRQLTKGAEELDRITRELEEMSTETFQDALGTTELYPKTEEKVKKAAQKISEDKRKFEKTWGISIEPTAFVRKLFCALTPPVYELEDGLDLPKLLENIDNELSRTSADADVLKFYQVQAMTTAHRDCSVITELVNLLDLYKEYVCVPL